MSGLLVAAAWPPWDFAFLGWVALVPWFVAIGRQRGFARSLALGLWLAFVVGSLSAYWVAHAAQEFLELSSPFDILVLLVFSATCAQPHFVLAAPLVYWGSRQLRAGPSVVRSLSVCLCLALLYVGLDWAVPRLFDVGLGYALHASPRLRQMADLGGVSLLTFALVFVNLLVWRSSATIRSDERPPTDIGVYALVSGAVLALAASYGGARNRANAELIDGAEATLQVGMVQGNVANDTRLAWARGDEPAAEKQLSAYMLPTDELARETPSQELIVWPEAAFPGVFMQPRSTLQRGRANKLDRQLIRLNRPIVFGAYDHEQTGEGEALYNALFAVNPRYATPGAQGTVQRYRKHELLPFAETIPGVSQSDWFRRNLPSLGFFRAGPGPGLFELETPDGKLVSVGPFICSESLSSQHVIETAQRGADVLLNVGSDGWFGRWGEPQFHLAAARLRSVETRRVQVRAANTGISALILPGGEIPVRTTIGVPTTLNVTVPLVAEEQTLVMRWGDWFGRAALVLGVLMMIVLVRAGPASRARQSGA